MAGKWEKTDTPGIFKQPGPRTGRNRYKIAFRDARGTVTSRTFPTKKLALAAQADLRVKKATGSLPDVSKSRHKVTELFEHLRKTGRQRPSTMAWYESRWTKHVEFVLGSHRVDSVRRSELETFLADLEARSSLATRRAVQQLLHKLFAVAVRSEWIQRNLADGIEMPAAHPRDARFLTEDEVRRVAGEVAPRYRALVWTLALAGLRIGEATAPRVKNLITCSPPSTAGRSGSQTSASECSNPPLSARR